MSSSACHSVLYKVVFWVMCLAIFVLALLPNNSSSIAFPEADKLLHLMAFAGLSFIGCLAHPYRIFVLTLFLVFLGGAIEVAQGFTTDRARALFDFFADVVGIGAGLMTYRLSQRGFLRK